MSKIRVEIWMGGMTNPTYTIEDPKRIDMSIDSTTVRIVDFEDWVFETSPHNVVIVSAPEEKK